MATVEVLAILATVVVHLVVELGASTVFGRSGTHSVDELDGTWLSWYLTLSGTVLVYPCVEVLAVLCSRSCRS